MIVRRSQQRVVPVVAAVAAMVAMMSGCGARANAARRPVAAVHPGPAPQAQLVVVPAGGHHVRPDAGVTVTTLNGRIATVTVRAGRVPAPGLVSADGSSWHTLYALDPGTKYHVTATAVNRDGKLVSASSSFTTLSAGAVMTAWANIPAGSTVGVGEPLVIQFDHPVANQTAVEQALVLTTSTPVTGAWSWSGDQEVDFRPQVFWPAHTSVHLSFHAAGLRGADGAYATQNLSLSFHIGKSQVAIVNTKSHRLSYYVDGRRLWYWPESSGMHAVNPATGTYFDTEDGTFVVLYKKNPEIMSSASVGIKSGPFFYPPTPVYWSVKFTPSGDYLHSAPWSLGQQGFENVSHGCVNLSPGHAELIYNRAQVGDVVIIKNSPVRATSGDVTDWMYSWSHWLSHSTLGAITTAALG
jgi:lipoprotein-anchoring transpeptidase ErfK/SrfK